MDPILSELLMAFVGGLLTSLLITVSDLKSNSISPIAHLICGAIGGILAVIVVNQPESVSISVALLIKAVSRGAFSGLVGGAIGLMVNQLVHFQPSR